MISEKAEVVNVLGIHARPAAQIVRKAAIFESHITLSVENDKVNAKSIMGVMTLAACRGSTIEVRADGSDEIEALEAIIVLINEGFGEE
ncbi:MAG: HPr family phosphocarrier protein [Candidatus Fermentibacteraceae bacterium]|nr:HPr family phosphocarrier protein [Candidatus Fermentibacteraceae bacterium]